MNEQSDDEQQQIEQEQELLSNVSSYTLERVLGGYFTGTRFIYEGKYEIAIGCLTTSIGLVPLPYLYRLRAIAFLNHDLCAKCLTDCDYYCDYHTKRDSEANERYLMDGLLVRAHANILSHNYKEAHRDLEYLIQITGKYYSSFKKSDQRQEQQQQQQQQQKEEENGENGEEECDEDGDDELTIDALNILFSLSERLLAISEIPERKRSESVKIEFETVRSKLCLYCEEYEMMIVHFELEWIESHHGDLLQSINLDLPLSIEDVVTLASSQDVNARSMGAVLLSDKFDEVSQTEDENMMSELEISGGIDAIIDSLINWKDAELKFFATKAISDVCWSGNASVRWKIINGRVLPELIAQLRSDDTDLVGVSVSAIAILGRGGTGIDRIVREEGGIDALKNLLFRSTLLDKNLSYITQAFTLLSGDIDNKIYIANDKFTTPILYSVASEDRNPVARKFAIAALGNILQNPEIWGKPEKYGLINALVCDLISNGIVSLLMKYATSEDASNSTDAMELQINSICTLTHLIGFKAVRDKLEEMGGERIFYDLLYSSTNSVLSDVLSRAIRFYRTLQDYGDHMADVLLPRYRLTLQTNNEIESAHSSISTVLKNTLENQNTGLFGIGQPINQQPPKPSSEQALTNELLKILDMKIMKEKKEAVSQKDPENTEALSDLVNGLFDVASYVWNGDEEKKKEKKVSKTKQKNQKKKQKKKAAKEQKKQAEQKLKQIQSQERKKAEAKETHVVTVKQETTTNRKPVSEEETQPATTASSQIEENGEFADSSDELEQGGASEEPQIDPYVTFLGEFESGMNILAQTFDWGLV